MIVPLLFVPLVYGLSSTPDACAAIKYYEFCGKVAGKPDTEQCCWFERDKYGNEKQFCQTCTGKGTDVVICEDPEPASIQQPPAATPAPGPFVLPEDGVLQQPTPASPLGPRPFTPQGEATVQQPPQTTPPEDDQGDDGLGPFTGPLGDRVLPELEQEGESEDGGEEKEESSIEEQPSTRE